MIVNALLFVAASLIAAFVSALLKASDPRSVVREGLHFAAMIIGGILAFSAVVFAIGYLFGGGTAPAP